MVAVTNTTTVTTLLARAHVTVVAVQVLAEHK
jgi:hypothetical protein